MSIPTRPTEPEAPIVTASDKGGIYEVTLQDGTVLWVPQTDTNNDWLQVEAWADTGNSNLQD